MNIFNKTIHARLRKNLKFLTNKNFYVDIYKKNIKGIGVFDLHFQDNR